MAFNFARDWPVLIVVGVFLGFIVYAYFNGKKNSQGDHSDKQDTAKK